MSVAERDKQAQALRAQGLTYREIGERMGESEGHAWKRCNREKDRATSRSYKARNRERLRAYDREYNATHKGACSSCGAEVYRHRDGVVCAACRHDEYDRKAREVIRLWTEGKTYPEIQKAMGWSKGMLTQMMDYYRADGYDLPYRYSGRVNGTRYPEQVPGMIDWREQIPPGWRTPETCARSSKPESGGARPSGAADPGRTPGAHTPLDPRNRRREDQASAASTPEGSSDADSG